MSILTKPLPETVRVDGKEYGINTDFRRWLEFEKISIDGAMSEQDRIVRMLQLGYRYELPSNIGLALQALIDFYKGGHDTVKTYQKGEGNKKRAYDFEYDAPYIYAAFLAQYQIDLQTATLHWWQFRALFQALSEDNQIVKIMEYRSMDLSKIKDKEQKARYRKMQQIYALPRPKAMQQELDKMAEILNGSGDLSQLQNGGM